MKKYYGFVIPNLWAIGLCVVTWTCNGLNEHLLMLIAGCTAANTLAVIILIGDDYDN